ncbi:MAG: acetyltransferase [Dokdonella sp.]|uniref:acetyltransferase n=1 Tax=Dokdonella sp. TaxID=2291710 RepID=UPI0032657296
MIPVIFWGATGHALALRDALDPEHVSLVALFDNRPVPSPFDDLRVFEGPSGLVEWEHLYAGDRPIRASVAIGGGNGRDRLSILRWLEARGYPPVTIVHPRAFVAAGALLGDGCQVMALGAVCANSKLGDAVIINTKASVDHGCVIGNGVHIAPGATLAGEVVVQDFAFVGAGAVILPRIRIGRGATVGAGAVVTRDVPDSQTVVGNPARVLIANISKKEI